MKRGEGFPMNHPECLKSEFLAGNTHIIQGPKVSVYLSCDERPILGGMLLFSYPPAL